MLLGPWQGEAGTGLEGGVRYLRYVPRQLELAEEESGRVWGISVCVAAGTVCPRKWCGKKLEAITITPYLTLISLESLSIISCTTSWGSSVILCGNEEL